MRDHRSNVVERRRAFGRRGAFAAAAVCGAWLSVAVRQAAGIDTGWVNAAGGDYTVAGNWHTNQVPGAGEAIRFDLAGAYTVRVPGDRSAGQVRVLAGNVTWSAYASLSPLVPATFSTGDVSFEPGSGETAALNLATAGTFRPGQVSVGRGAIGAAGMSTLNVAGPVRYEGQGALLVGRRTDGTLNLSGGGQLSAPAVTLGAIAGGAGTANVSGPGTRADVVGPLTVGAESGGTMTVELGALVAVGGSAVVGKSGGASGTMTVQSGGVVSVGGNAVLGELAGATGTLNVNAGGLFSAASLTLSAPQGANGILNVAGAGATVQVGGALRVGADTSQSRMVVGDGAAVSAGSMFVGKFAKADVTGGVTTIAGAATLQGGGYLKLSCGKLSVGSLVYPVQTEQFGFFWTGGTLELTGEAGVTIGGPNASFPAFADDLTLTAQRTLVVTHGALVDASQKFLLDGGSASLGELSNHGSVRATNGGSLAAGETSNAGAILLDGANASFTGTVVNGGTLSASAAQLTFPGGPKDAPDAGLVNAGAAAFAGCVVNGNVYAAAGSSLSASNTTFNGLLSGSGQVALSGAITFNGGISPGDSPGAWLVTGGAAFGPGSVSTFELFSPASLDRLAVTGNLAFDGTLVVQWKGVGAGPSPGEVYDLFDFAGSTGRFGQVTLPPLPAGMKWDASKLYSSGVLAVVPEPGGVGALCAVAGAMGVRRGRRAG